ncbi:MAG: hypothetical protein NC413_11365 [Muribaculum sp.]|nr:hypothetical protein [Muribaculum sp.]
MRTERTMKMIKRLLVCLMIAGMLWVWPIHPFREVGSVRSGNDGHMLTEPLEVGESLTQHFRPADNNIIQMEFVLAFDDAAPRTGELLFELLDRDGNALYTEQMDYAQIADDCRYCGPIVNQRVKQGGRYAYRITNLSVTENLPCGLYTTDKTMTGLKKGTLETPKETIEGELVTRITANKALTAENTLAIWGCMGMVTFGVLEALERYERRQKSTKTN